MVQTSEELVRRIVKGNDWCRAAWQRCCDAADGDETAWHRQLEMFHRGTARLDILCLQLEASGYEKCLYQKPICLDTDEVACWACLVTDRSTVGHPSALPLDMLETTVSSSTPTRGGVVI